MLKCTAALVPVRNYAVIITGSSMTGSGEPNGSQSWKSSTSPDPYWNSKGFVKHGIPQPKSPNLLPISALACATNDFHGRLKVERLCSKPRSQVARHGLWEHPPSGTHLRTLTIIHSLLVHTQAKPGRKCF